MAITISGENNNDKILASDGVIDQISGFSIVGVMTATSFTGDLTGDVTGNLTGNVTGNINNTTLLLQTGGAERLRIDSNGRVLIGTTTEGHVNADNLTIADSGNSGITIRSGTSNNGIIYFSDGTSGASEYRGIIDYDHNDDSMSFTTNATERLRISSAGDLGLGINNPARKFHIHVNSSDANYQLFTNSTTGTNSNDGLLVGIQADEDAIFWNYENTDTRFATNATEKVRITSGGSVNIATTSSRLSQTTFKSQIETGTNKLISFGDAEGSTYSDQGAAVIFSRPSDGAEKICAIFQHTNQSLGIAARDVFTISTGGNAFYYSTTERLRITSGGNVNIGSNLNQTTYVCEIAGAYNKNGLRIVSGAPSYQDPFVVASSTGGERFRIKGDGQINLGSRTATSGSQTTPDHFRISRSDNAGAPLITMGAHETAQSSSAPGAVISSNHRDFIITKYFPDFTGNSPGFWLKSNEIRMYSGSSETLRLGGDKKITVAANSDIRFTNGTWTGEVAGKIQHNSNNLYIQGGTGGIRFRHASSGVNQFTMTNGGNFEITDGDLVVASGHGIDFSAETNEGSTSQNALLADYEEGVWTPTNTIGMTLTVNNGAHYIKIGKQVTVWFDITLTGNPDSAQCAIIQSLPYVSKSSNTYYGQSNSVWYSNTGDAKKDYDDDNTLIFVDNNSTDIKIWNITSGHLRVRSWASGRRFRGTVTYLAKN